MKNRLLQKRTINYLPALVVPLIYLVIILLTATVSYTTSDDAPHMMHILAGYVLNEPIGWSMFLDPILSVVISTLYRVIPGVEWYSVLQLGIIVFSMMVINQCCFGVLEKSNVKCNILLKAILSILIDGLFCWILIRMHFYYVSAIAGCAAIAIIFVCDYSKKRWGVQMALAMLMIWICVAYFRESAKSVLCFIVLTFAYRIADYLFGRKEKFFGKKIMSLLFLTLLSCLIVFDSTKLWSLEFGNTNGKEYVEWNEYRISWFDYYRPSYTDNVEAFNAAGWDNDYYNLAQQSFYMDDRFSVSRMSEIITPYGSAGTQVSNQLFQNSIKLFQDLLDAEREAKGLYILILSIFVGGLLCIGKDRHVIILLIFHVFCFAGAAILCIYLCLRNRFPLRAFAVIAMPCLTYMILTLSYLFSTKVKLVAIAIKEVALQFKESLLSPLATRRVVIKTIYVLIVFSVICRGYIGYANRNYATLSAPENNTYYSGLIQQERTLYGYTKTHKDKIFIYDKSNYNEVDPFPDLKVGDLTNVFSWGGLIYKSYVYRLQLELNNLDSLSSENLDDENVYFISNKPKNIQRLTSFLKRNYGMDRCFVVDLLDNSYLVLKYCSSNERYSREFRKWVSSLQPLTDEIIAQHTGSTGK